MKIDKIFEKIKHGAKSVLIFIIRNRRYFCAGIVFVFIMVLLFTCAKPNISDKDPMKTVSEKYSTKPSKELKKLVDDYYKYYAAGDVDSIKKIASPVSEQEESYIKFYSEYIDEFVNPEIYTKAGMSEGSYLTSVVVDVKFKDIDTPAPGCDFFYIETNESGKLYINNTYGSFNQTNGIYEMDSDITALIAAYISQDDVIELQSKITKAYNEAILKDEKLKKFINNSLKDAIVEWNNSYAEQAKAAEEAAAEAEKAAEEEAKKAKAEKEKADREAENKAAGAKPGVANKNVNVRASADKESDRLGKLQGGTEVQVLGKEGDFYKIDFNGKDGYVAKEYLDVEGEEPEPAEEETESNAAGLSEGSKITLDSTVNIRSKMDTDSSKVAVAYAGDEVTVVMSYSEGWTKVKFGKKEGYIKTDLLTK